MSNPLQIQKLWKAIRRNKGLACALVLLGLIVVSSTLLPLPHDPFQPHPYQTLRSPDGEFWFGTDRVGFDIFSRTIRSARVDLPVSVAGTFVSLTVGVAIGLAVSAKGRWSERIMRCLDMFQAFPLLVLAIVIVALTGNNLRNVVVAIALVNIPRFIRLVRSEALALRETRFIEAATSIGASRSRVMVRHLLPNMAGVIAAQASLAAAHAIIVVAGLSFLGIGIAPPQASWGTMIKSGSQNIATGHWWVAVFPGLAVFVVVTAFNAVADGIYRLLAGDDQ
jgi:peptide/nickel transport system permease protein